MDSLTNIRSSLRRIGRVISKVVASAKVIVSQTPSSPKNFGKTARPKRMKISPRMRAIIVVTLILSTDWK